MGAFVYTQRARKTRTLLRSKSKMFARVSLVRRRGNVRNFRYPWAGQNVRGLLRTGYIPKIADYARATGKAINKRGFVVVVVVPRQRRTTRRCFSYVKHPTNDRYGRPYTVRGLLLDHGNGYAVPSFATAVCVLNNRTGRLGMYRGPYRICTFFLKHESYDGGSSKFS